MRQQSYEQNATECDIESVIEFGETQLDPVSK